MSSMHALTLDADLVFADREGPHARAVAEVLRKFDEHARMISDSGNELVSDHHAPDVAAEAVLTLQAALPELQRISQALSQADVLLNEHDIFTLRVARVLAEIIPTLSPSGIAR